MKLILFILTICIAQQISAQAYKDSIRNQFKYYNELLRNKEFSKSMDYLNTAIYKVAPKEDLLQMIEQTFNNPDVDIKLSEPTVKNVGDTKVINNITYSVFEYTGDMSMRFKAEEMKNDTTGATKSLLATQFGEQNVTYDRASGFYNIKVVKKVVANSDDLKKWTFLVIEESQKEMLGTLIPKELF